MRTLPSMDMTDPKNIESAQKSDNPTGVSGKYVATIEHAHLDEAQNGSVFVKLSFKMPNGKVYKQDAKQILRGEKDNFDEGFYAAKLRSLFGITGAKDTIGSVTIKDGEFENGQWVEKEIEVPAYVDLIGRKIGVVLHFYQKYPESLGMNGYTGRAIPARSENRQAYDDAKNQATTIWMPNYEKDAQAVFEFVQFYNPETEKSFSEMLDDNCTEPKAVADALDNVMKKEHKAIKLDNVKLDELRIKKLKANLKKSGITYDERMFVPSVGSTVRNVKETETDTI